jgi:arsenical pump membrane protein
VGALALVAFAARHRSHQLIPAARGTADPFLTLAGIILAAALADRLGLFRLLASLLVPERASRHAAAAAVLAFTALLSSLVNLDVAVVVAMPVALRASSPSGGLPRRWLAAAVAVTANATSFLLPTSNITTLLVLGRAPLSTGTYVAESWLPWLLVTAVTVATLTVAVGRGGAGETRLVDTAAGVGAVLDLAPMFLAASAIRALLGPGLVLHGTFAEQVASGSALASALNNLPAAAALRAVGSSGRWAAILAMAVGPNLFITGSVATLLCRRIARDGGAAMSVWRFTAMGVALLPLQLATAALGLRVTGALR